MKKLKNYILMLLVPLILLGCVSKGVSDSVTEDATVSADSNLAALINSNRNRIATSFYWFRLSIFYFRRPRSFAYIASKSHFRRI